jgi:hypothetical protein
MSQSRCVRIGSGVGLASAEASSRTARQYSGGMSSPGPIAGDPGAFPPTGAADASLSICFRVGMRQLAGWSIIPP